MDSGLVDLGMNHLGAFGLVYLTFFFFFDQLTEKWCWARVKMYRIGLKGLTCKTWAVVSEIDWACMKSGLDQICSH